jgi:hypothetical protein
MRGIRVWFIAVACTVVVASAAVTATRADDFEISRSTVDGGGVMFSTGGSFELSGTIGQPDAGVMQSPTGVFQLTGGFWFALAPGDCNTDGGVNLSDYAVWITCLSGPNAGAPADCACFDLDRDGDVDIADAAAFQMSFTGG